MTEPCEPKFPELPTAATFLNNLEVYQIVLISIASFLDVIIIVLAVVQWCKTWTTIPVQWRQHKFYFLYTLYPVTSLCFLVGMLIPRTESVITSSGALYTFMCMVVMVSIIRHSINERGLLTNDIDIEQRVINLRQPPCCSCCMCLPKIRSSLKNFRRLEWLVIQAAIVRAICTFVYIIVSVEFRDSASSVYKVANYILLVSFMFAMYGMNTIIDFSAEKLKNYLPLTVLRLLIFFTLFLVQHPTLFENILAKAGAFKDGPLLTKQANARFMCAFVMICETTILSIVTTYCVWQ